MIGLPVSLRERARAARRRLPRPSLSRPTLSRPSLSNLSPSGLSGVGSRLKHVAGPGRRALALWTVCALTLTVVVVTAGGGRAPGLAYRQIGHWLFDGSTQSAAHIDGGTKDVDARVNGIPSPSGSQVLADKKNGYVVGGKKIVVFGKSSLRVKTTVPMSIDETPVGVETVGGPYLVYRQHGEIVRLGDKPRYIATGGQVSTPVATSSGTLWMVRGAEACTLAAADSDVSCKVHLPAGHRGSLVTVGDRPVFMDTTAARMRPISGSTLTAGRPFGMRVPDGASAGPADVGGRVPVMAGRTLLLVDTHAHPSKPVTVSMDTGPGATMSTSGRSVVVLDPANHRLTTYGSDGRVLHRQTLAAGMNDPHLSRGEDGHVYVDGSDGRQSYVVDGDGSVTAVLVPGNVPTSPTPGSTTTPTPHPSTSRPTGTPPKAGGPRTSPTQSPPTQSRPTQTQQTPTPPAGPSAPSSPTEQPLPPVQQQTQQPTQRPAAPSSPRHTSPPTPSAHRPAAPGSVHATAGTGQATVTWTAASGNGAPVTGYVISWRSTGGNAPAGSTTVTGGNRSGTVTGLAAGTTYVLSVAAMNRVGTGSRVDANPVTTSAAAPNAPTGVQATAATNGSVTVRWNAIAGARYAVQAHSGGTARQVTAGAATNSITVPAGTIPAGTRATFGVIATDTSGRRSGESGQSNAVTPYVPAPAPRVTASGGYGTVTASWQPTGTGGGQIYAYAVSVAQQGVGTKQQRQVAAGTTSTTFSGLEHGRTFVVSVQALTREQGNTGSAPATGAAGSAQTGTMWTPTVTVSEGGQATDGSCTGASCRFMHVVLTGAAPNTTYHFQPGTNGSYNNPGADLTTDANGYLTTDRFAFDQVGKQVWVTVTGPDIQATTSNHYTWQ